LPEQSDLSNALADVRNAYRLLWSYQKRIFDIIRLMVDEFEDMDFYYWQIMHAARPCNWGTDPFGRWAWDMLPMVKASYLYLPSNVDRNLTRPGQWMLEFSLESDTGFEDPEDGTEPDVGGFKPSSECASLLKMYAWYCTGAAKLNWFGGVWQQIAWPETDGELVESADPPFRLVRKTFDISDLPDKEAVRSAALEFKVVASKALGVALA
jgi:hypothetical protein